MEPSRVKMTDRDIFILPHDLDLQTERVERNAKYLRNGKVRHRDFLRTREELVALSRSCSACATATLTSGCFGDPCLLELGDAYERIEADLFQFSGVDHVDDVGNGDGGLSSAEVGELPSTSTKLTALDLLQRHW